jgi:hypothetical protein
MAVRVEDSSTMALSAAKAATRACLPNGYWRADPQAGTRVSAVLMGRNIDPYGAAKDTPRMWINPWAPMPISETYGLATNNLQDDGQVLRTDGNLAVHELFDIPSDWPLVDKPPR